MSADLWLVVGLGNPGPTYARNRHNVGAMVVDALAEDVPGQFQRHRARAEVLDGRLGTMPGGAPGPRVVLAKPSSYMNLSGGPVAGLCTFYSVPPDRLLVIHDELDLPEHTLRLKRGGGSGGHNGLKSITAALGTGDYVRLRVGIDRPPGRMNPADYVLQDFPAAQRPEWAVTIEQGADVVRDVIHHGLERTQRVLHTQT